MRPYVIRGESAPPLGDLRTAQEGQTIHLYPSAKERPDWGRYIDAIAGAVAHGVNVKWVQP
ncbi:hypothetical protein ACWGH5_09775 [Streptomyces sp. NPDC054864]